MGQSTIVEIALLLLSMRGWCVVSKAKTVDSGSTCPKPAGGDDGLEMEGASIEKADRFKLNLHLTRQIS